MSEKKSTTAKREINQNNCQFFKVSLYRRARKLKPRHSRVTKDKLVQRSSVDELKTEISCKQW